MTHRIAVHVQLDPLPEAPDAPCSIEEAIRLREEAELWIRSSHQSLRRQLGEFYAAVETARKRSVMLERWIDSKIHGHHQRVSSFGRFSAAAPE